MLFGATIDYYKVFGHLKKTEHQIVSKQEKHKSEYLYISFSLSRRPIPSLIFVSNSSQEPHKNEEMWGEEKGSEAKLMTFL